MAIESSRLAGWPRWSWALACALMLARGAATHAQPPSQARSEPGIRRVSEELDSDPELPSRTLRVEVSNDPLTLWLEALRRPEPALRRVTIDTLAIAHRRGMPGVKEAAVGKLAELLETKTLTPQVRLAAVKALVQMDAAEHAPLLANLSRQHQGDVRRVVEPALIDWGADALESVWLERLEDETADVAMLRRAIEGLAAMESQRAAEPLLAILEDRSLSPPLRLSAARGLGQLRSSGLVQRARRLASASQRPIENQLLAAALLSRHSGPSAVDLLKQLVEADSSVVQSESLGRLFEIDPELVLPFVDPRLSSPDVNVRRTLAEALIWDGDAAQMSALASLLDDVNPDLRRRAATALVNFGKQPELQDEVIAQAAAVLERDAWRGCEQAAIVLVNLDHQPAGDRLVDLLNHPRAEVQVTAGWGLRQLKLRQHLPLMLERAEAIYGGFREGRLSTRSPGAEALLVQLFMAFGQMRYEPAIPLLRRYVPRNFDLGERARAAAIWALGLIFEDQVQQDLVAQFSKRLDDIYGMEPEFEAVRRMSAISMGRMNAESALPMLRKHAGTEGGAAGLACLWAIEQITGEPMPELDDPPPLDYRDWFLMPLDRDTSP